MLDSELRLCGESAVAFHNLMTRIDLDAISSRDKFVSNVDCHIDDDGVLSIDISDLNVDLSVMNEDDGNTVDTKPVLKDEKYVVSIDVQYTTDIISSPVVRNDSGNKMYFANNDSYTLDKIYQVKQSIAIKFAA